jgi:acetylornithine deacetylase
VPYTTVHVGTIKGGTALNIVPRDCDFRFEFRHLPFDDPDLLLREVKTFAERFLPEMHAVARTRHHVRGALRVAWLRHGRRQRDRRARPLLQPRHVVNKVSFGAEASLFHNAGIPAILCGPGHIAQAHQPNEWVGQRRWRSARRSCAGSSTR